MEAPGWAASHLYKGRLQLLERRKMLGGHEVKGVLYPLRRAPGGMGSKAKGRVVQIDKFNKGYLAGSVIALPRPSVLPCGTPSEPGEASEWLPSPMANRSPCETLASPSSASQTGSSPVTLAALQAACALHQLKVVERCEGLPGVVKRAKQGISGSSTSTII